MKPLLDGPAWGAKQIFAVPWRDAPELTHQLHWFVCAGNPVQFGRFFQFLDIYIEACLALKPVGNIVSCHFWHGGQFLLCPIFCLVSFNIYHAKHVVKHEFSGNPFRSGLVFLFSPCYTGKDMF